MKTSNRQRIKTARNSITAAASNDGNVTRRNVAFILKKTYLDGLVSYFNSEDECLWCTTVDINQAYRFRTSKQAKRLRDRWVQDQAAKGRHCPVEIVEITKAPDKTTHYIPKLSFAA